MLTPRLRPLAGVNSVKTESSRRSLPIPSGLIGERLDVALTRLLGISRSNAAKLCDSGSVEIDGAPGRKSDRLMHEGWLDVDLPQVQTEPDSIKAEPVPGMGILYDDEDLVVIDKPVGVAAHSSPGWSGPTVLGALKAAGYRISTSGASERQGIVQRLDVGTSGAMIVTKSEIAYSVLKRAFRNRTVEKRYHALVQGLPDPLSGSIDAPIGRHPVHAFRRAVIAEGKHSITHYELLEAFGSASLMDVNLETGRTHQIRVHFAALKHPLVGDITYGADPRMAEELGLTRQWLHAVGVGFEHPTTGKWMSVESPYPEDLQQVLERYRSRS